MRGVKRGERGREQRQEQRERAGGDRTKEGTANRGGGREQGGMGKLENDSRVCVSVPDVLRVGRCRLDLAPITFVTGVTAD